MAWDPTLKARPTVYKGIQMRSRLEAGYAAWLDGVGLRWEYEPCAFAGADGQYLPDFLIHDLPVLGWSRPARAFVEVKPTAPPLAVARRMTSIWDSEPDAVLLICTPAQDDETHMDDRFIRATMVVREASQVSTAIAFWCKASRFGEAERLGLALPYGAQGGPWFGEWWRRGAPATERPATPHSHIGVGVGDHVSHDAFGSGVVLEVFGDAANPQARIDFPSVGEKVLLLSWAPIKKMDPVG